MDISQIRDLLIRLCGDQNEQAKDISTQEDLSRYLEHLPEEDKMSLQERMADYFFSTDCCKDLDGKPVPHLSLSDLPHISTLKNPKNGICETE